MKKATQRYEDKVGEINVHVVKNSALHEEANALVLPEFNDRMNRGGIAAQIYAHKDGRKGIEAFEKHLRATDMKMGEAFISRYDGPYILGVTPAAPSKNHPDFLIHVTTARAVGLSNPQTIDPKQVSEYRDEQWHDVQQSIADMIVHLRDANLNLKGSARITTLNLPLLGCGVTGTLSFEQSAQAMLQTIHDGARLLKRAGIQNINITVHNPSEPEKVEEMFKAASHVLQTKSYEDAQPARGGKSFSMKAYYDEKGYSEAILKGSGFQPTGFNYKQVGLN